MIISLRKYKVHRSIHQLSVHLHQDLLQALMHQNRVYLTLLPEERSVVEPHLQLLQAEGAAYFWELTDEARRSTEEELLYVGAASEDFQQELAPDRRTEHHRPGQRTKGDRTNACAKR